eukprot:TRINITY_DN11530_c2_g1_i3.p1 TRINITY_DN11530_c2_g1~~TRINITY_DN11530_c2_g1_i3.p1  ORF type:complete len:507 (+),score=83.28 TRINITY_DN11530_c2_g1_i3:41-1522(+)
MAKTAVPPPELLPEMPPAPPPIPQRLPVKSLMQPPPPSLPLQPQSKQLSPVLPSTTATPVTGGHNSSSSNTRSTTHSIRASYDNTTHSSTEDAILRAFEACARCLTREKLRKGSNFEVALLLNTYAKLHNLRATPACTFSGITTCDATGWANGRCSNNEVRGPGGSSTDSSITASSSNCNRRGINESNNYESSSSSSSTNSAIPGLMTNVLAELDERCSVDKFEKSRRTLDVVAVSLILGALARLNLLPTPVLERGLLEPLQTVSSDSRDLDLVRTVGLLNSLLRLDYASPASPSRTSFDILLRRLTTLLTQVFEDSGLDSTARRPLMKSWSSHTLPTALDTVSMLCCDALCGKSWLRCCQLLVDLESDMLRQLQQQQAAGKAGSVANALSDSTKRMAVASVELVGIRQAWQAVLMLFHFRLKPNLKYRNGASSSDLCSGHSNVSYGHPLELNIEFLRSCHNLVSSSWRRAERYTHRRSLRCSSCRFRRYQQN